MRRFSASGGERRDQFRRPGSAWPMWKVRGRGGDVRIEGGIEGVERPRARGARIAFGKHERGRPGPLLHDAEPGAAVTGALEPRVLRHGRNRRICDWTLRRARRAAFGAGIPSSVTLVTAQLVD